MHFVGALLATVGLTLAGCSHPKGEQQPASAQFSAPVQNQKPGIVTKELTLQPGSTSLSVRGTLDAGKDAEFLIAGQRGSVFMAHAITPERDLDIQVYRADTGERITDETPVNPAFFTAKLPATLGYLVVVRGAEAASPYTLEIEVPFQLFFDQSRSVSVTNSAASNTVVEYLAPSSASISANLTAGAADAFLTVHGLAGKQLLKAEANSRSFQGGAVRQNEGVVISVNQGVSNGDFTLRVQENK